MSGKKRIKGDKPKRSERGMFLRAPLLRCIGLRRSVRELCWTCFFLFKVRPLFPHLTEFRNLETTLIK